MEEATSINLDERTTYLMQVFLKGSVRKLKLVSVSEETYKCKALISLINSLRLLT